MMIKSIRRPRFLVVQGDGIAGVPGVSIEEAIHGFMVSWPVSMAVRE